MIRRAASVDVNQPAIVKAFRKMGCAVLPLHTLGQGVPDFLVSFRQANHLVEIKNPKASPKRRKPNEIQKRWHDNWQAPVHIVQSIDDVQTLVMQWGELWRAV